MTHKISTLKLEFKLKVVHKRALAQHLLRNGLVCFVFNLHVHGTPRNFIKKKEADSIIPQI